MRVLTTGGTGLLGNTLIRTLHKAGDHAVALVRSEPPRELFEGLDVSLVYSELVPSGSDLEDSDADSDAIDDAISDCDAVIHSAAMIHLGWRKMDESHRVNQVGTQRIVDACLRHGKKLALVGTVNTLAVGSRQTIADEDTPIDHAGGQIPCAYVVSKRASVTVVQQAVAKGLDAVILHPGFMLGPWDWKPSSGRMMLEVGNGWKPIAPSGGCSLCDSRDVADAILSALKKDTRPGREYILAGHNWTYLKLWTEMAKRMGTKKPLRAAGPGMEFLAGAVGDLWTKLSGREPDFNSAGVAMSGQYHWYTSRRAIDELGYQIRDAEQTLDDASEWIHSRFVLPRRSAKQ